MAYDARLPGALWGAVIGDALGVPVEFTSRQEREADPVLEMRAFGTHFQPQGTWSDDSSLFLTTLESLLERESLDLEDVAKRFQRWLYEAEWTPYGEVFDIGGTTREAIERMKGGCEPTAAGSDGEFSNGNGSLMRIAPLVLAFPRLSAEILIQQASQLSALTHGHPLSRACCAWFCLFLSSLLKDTSLARPDETLEEAIAVAWQEFDRAAPTELRDAAETLRCFERLSDLRNMTAEGIRSSGYVLHCLVASLWSVATSRDFEEALLKAVNLGEDTDTTACVTGVVAGALWGIDPIPGRWHRCLARRDDLADLIYRAGQRFPLC